MNIVYIVPLRKEHTLANMTDLSKVDKNFSSLLDQDFSFKLHRQNGEPKLNLFRFVGFRDIGIKNSVYLCNKYEIFKSNGVIIGVFSSEVSNDLVFDFSSKAIDFLSNEIDARDLYLSLWSILK